MPDSDNRILWLGMHIVLTRTELPRLRQMGYEVFNPPYRSMIYDQSADLDWDVAQPTTLPKEVFDLLARTDFFYKPIPRNVADVLNEYFGTVIVTINPDWLNEVLKVYRGRVIYRIYGQLFSICDSIFDRELLDNIQQRDDFFVVSHAEEAVIDEHDWLKNRMRVVPYMLAPDVFGCEGTWEQFDHRREIMVNIPNIANPYYANMYHHISTFFTEDHFRIYGIQREPVDDPQVVGTLTRDQLLESFQTIAGLYYPYHEKRVCYLPPIEMMTIGGPVLYVKNSLLASYFGHPTPGLVEDVDEAKKKARWLLRGDRRFIHEVIESQTPVARRYHPDHVWPIFEKTFSDLISGEVQPRLAPTLILSDFGAPPDPPADAESKKRVYILFHFPGGVVQHIDGEYFSAEGVPRVVQKFVSALLQITDAEIVLTCASHRLFHTEGFFDASASDGRIKVLSIDQLWQRGGLIRRIRVAVQRVRRRTRRLSYGMGAGMRRLRAKVYAFGGKLWSPTWLMLWPFRLAALIVLYVAHFAGRVFERLVVWSYRTLRWLSHVPGRKIKACLYRSTLLRRLARVGFVDSFRRHLEQRKRRKYVAFVNADPNVEFVLVPHYYLFPEAQAVTAPTVLYLADYTPHFFPDQVFEPGRDEANVKIGRGLANSCTAIFTNSEFSKSYLPETALQAPADRITSIPIPLLIGERSDQTDDAEGPIIDHLDGKRFICYPTQNRPNKQIALLLEIFAEVLKTHPELHLVLTCSLDSFPEARRTYERLAGDEDEATEPDAENAGDSPSRFADQVLLFEAISDQELAWLYRHASLLCLTSTMEGNFPPQIFEALTFGTPVVATRLALITEILQEHSDDLLLCEPLAKQEFVNNVLRALEHPDEVRDRQKRVYQVLLAHSSDERFNEQLRQFLQQYDLC